jgi:glucose-6-phosphate isomerase
LYERSVSTQGTTWNVDSLDQWGGNVGNALAQRPGLENKDETGFRMTARTAP